MKEEAAKQGLQAMTAGVIWQHDLWQQLGAGGLTQYYAPEMQVDAAGFGEYESPAALRKHGVKLSSSVVTLETAMGSIRKGSVLNAATAVALAKTSFSSAQSRQTFRTLCATKTLVKRVNISSFNQHCTYRNIPYP